MNPSDYVDIAIQKAFSKGVSLTHMLNTMMALMEQMEYYHYENGDITKAKRAVKYGLILMKAKQQILKAK